MKKRSRFIYTIRTADDMAVFYVGCCDLRMCRIATHRNGSRPVAVHIRRLQSEGRQLVTVIEEEVKPSNQVLKHWAFVERNYIKGYAALIGDRLMNVRDNPFRKNRKAG